MFECRPKHQLRILVPERESRQQKLACYLIMRCFHCAESLRGRAAFYFRTYTIL